MWHVTYHVIYKTKNNNLYLDMYVKSIRNEKAEVKRQVVYNVKETEIENIVYKNLLRFYKQIRKGSTDAFQLKIKYTNNKVYLRLLNEENGYFDQLINYLMYYNDYRIVFIKMKIQNKMKELKSIG